MHSGSTGDAALAHFVAEKDASNWIPGDATYEGFHFEMQKSDGSDERFNRYNYSFNGGRILSDGETAGTNDESFARWIAFGRDTRILGGLGAAVSPLLAGTSDLTQARELSHDRRVLCAWRRAGGELLIYRRSLPVK